MQGEVAAYKRQKTEEVVTAWWYITQIALGHAGHLEYTYLER